MLFKRHLLLLLAVSLVWACQPKPDHWQIIISGAGSLSSPRCIDLNKDGHLDIVMGAGKEEFIPTDTGIVAINGKNGNILWAVPANDQMFGSPVFADITADNVPDVFIAGRAAQLLAINGNNGEIIWDFAELNKGKATWYNFYNPQLISGDKPMLLISNGGDVTVKPYDPQRPAGKLLLLDAHTGNIIISDTMPDGRETYFSPVIQTKPGGDMIIFGTGGETIGGHLYAVPLNALANGNIQKAKILAVDSLKGFIAPPILTDLNEDQIEDIIVNAVNGRLLAIDGNSYQLLWEINQPGFEVYAAPCPGNFNGDNIPDFFANFSEGIWPDVVRCKQLVVDGKDGHIILTDSAGFFQMASPISVDLDQDGFDEVILSLNYEYFPATASGITIPPTIRNHLQVFDIEKKEHYPITEGIDGANMAITPWLGDLDDDGFIDIVYGAHKNSPNFTEFKNLTIKRTELEKDLPATFWGKYMGNQFNCRY